MPQPGLGMGSDSTGVLEQNLPRALLGLDPQHSTGLGAELQALGAAAGQDITPMFKPCELLPDCPPAP